MKLKSIFDNLLLNQHRRQIVRIAYAAMIAFIIIVCTHLWAILPRFNKDNERLKEYFKEKQIVENLESLCGDSTLSGKRMEPQKGVMLGWGDAAQWLETIRITALASNIECSYRIDSLIALSPSESRYFRIPVYLTAQPNDKKFQTVMHFIETVSADSSHSLSLESAEFFGDETGLANALFTLFGWIKL
ncbi:MAG: hypothetical protein JW795_11655 [Chitinivibrionales bacterium]|nr:hypothetical protein [Chitinivibrionales bacterium]